MYKKRIAATAAAVILTASCMFAAQTNISAENTDNIQNGPTITSTGKIKTKNNKVVIDSKDMQNLSDAVTNNAKVFLNTKNELQENMNSVKDELQSNIDSTKNELQTNIDSTKNELQSSINSTKNELQEVKNFAEGNAVIVIDGFTCSGNSHTVSDEAIKDAKSVQVNYADKAYDIVPSYSVDTDAGKLTISNVKSGVVVKNIIVYH